MTNTTPEEAAPVQEQAAAPYDAACKELADNDYFDI